MIILFNSLILIVCVVIFYNIKAGFLLALILKILVPSVVRLQFGPINLAIGDVMTIALSISYVFHMNKIHAVMPSKLKKYFCIYICSIPILIVCSTAFVPYSFQVSSFLKGFLFQMILFIVLGYYVLAVSNIRFVINVLCVISIFAGLYGIFSYVVGNNLYVGSLNLLYGSEDVFAYFMDEERGGLKI